MIARTGLKLESTFELYNSYFLRLLLPGAAVFFWVALGGAFRAGALPLGSAFGGALGGGALWPPALGGTARIRHLGPEPMRSSRWAASKASRTR